MSVVRIEERDGIATITVHRPEKLNALTEEVLDALRAAFERCRDEASVRAAILTGAGDRAFIAGADLGELGRLDPAGARRNALKGQALTLLIENLGKPVVAAINGFALGGGCEIALACTFRVAAEGARLGQPEVKLGIICGYGGSQRLPRLVGRGPALEMLLTGEPVEAAQALRMGLVHRVVPREQLLEESRALLAKVLAAGPLAVRATLEAVRRGMELPLEEALRVEADLFARCFETRDMREGVSAFLEKRPPKFTGS
ncbi:MAG TPA: enoyl-CoA hydratase-related protein [Planctomycetota bacterium]|jgi:enoyl-CoA hydratase|nr:enoyl-CoA hydratase-related protein [Planctomycetota bacterium]